VFRIIQIEALFGLSLVEALIFWRKSFNRISDDEFNKKVYAHNILYNNGMEGKRTNYTPYSCIRIISGMPGPGDTHGCPFRHFPPETLESMVEKMHVNIQEIQLRSKESHYQMACTKLYEVLAGWCTRKRMRSRMRLWKRSSTRTYGLISALPVPAT
jgi:DNA primase large subunit